jgi:WD40 repeat protein
MFRRMLKKYAALLVHPSADIRYYAVKTVSAACRALGFPDGEVFVVPLLRPFLRFQPSSEHLVLQDKLETCLYPSWDRTRFQNELGKFLAAKSSLSPTSGQWTSVDFQIRDGQVNSSPKGEGDQNPQIIDEKSSIDTDADLQTIQVQQYMKMLARSRTTFAGNLRSKPRLGNSIEGPLKLSQNIKFPRQDIPGYPSNYIPAWYNTLRAIKEEDMDFISEASAIRSVSALGEVYGLSIMEQSVVARALQEEIIDKDEAKRLLKSDESKIIMASCTGEWGSETCLDPSLSDTSLLVTKLNALQVPPLPPKLGEEKINPIRAPSNVRASPRDNSYSLGESKARIDTLVASSSTSSEHGHTAPVIRLAVSHDQRFFISGSHDGTCRVWETEKAQNCNGLLESTITYSGHGDGRDTKPRINDLVVVENGHSVCSGASDSSVHVWRVDIVTSIVKHPSAPANEANVYQRSRAVGSTEIRKVDAKEGEILAVNHFNTMSSSVMMFATQTGYIHSWDLRCAAEPFALKAPLGGYLTAMAVGSDRNWVVSGSSNGVIALWDLRFQQNVKLWRHSRKAPINRLATSIMPPPQSWSGRNGMGEARPFIFVASGPNECAMFDATTGDCREAFRTVDVGTRYSHAQLDDPPRLEELPVSSTARRRYLLSQASSTRLGDAIPSSFLSVNAMVGSIDATDNSFLMTGGSDSKIRYWDFGIPSKCYVSSGLDSSQPRPSFERIDFDKKCRMMICRQAPSPGLGGIDSSKLPRKLHQGLKKADIHHSDSIQDLKIVRRALVSCSRDSTVKLWK